jgi:H+/Cl- antiporter ClcA/predicted transcriptional regulator
MIAPLAPQLGDFSIDWRRFSVVTLYALLIGIAAAFIAKLLLYLIGLITHVAYLGQMQGGLVQPDPRHWGPIAIAIPVVGGLIVGVIARYGTDKIRGHGIPEAIQSILERDSVIQARVAFLKPIASAITIGTGGPFGAEGPIIMTGGAFGSLFAQFLRLSSLERRTLLVAGAAAGMAATFGAPIASVLIAVELLLFEWRPRSFVPVAIAAFAAEVLRVHIISPQPPFVVGHIIAFAPSQIGWALLVGLAGGIVSLIMTKLVYLAEDGYEKLHVHWMWWPAIGGLIVGIGGWIVPQALGVGYPTISGMLNGQLALAVVVGIIVVKIVIWIVALSSGTSGGVLAPLLMIGAAMGTLMATFIPGHDGGLWAIVGMAALMGGTMRAPFMGTLFALETTHAWAIAPAVFIGCVIATAFTVLFVPRSILTEKLARRGTHVAREYSVHPLELIAIDQVMTPRDRVAALDAEMTYAQAAAHLAEHSDRESSQLPVLASSGRVIGFVSRSEVLSPRNRGADDTIADLAHPVPTVHLGDRVREAANRMASEQAKAVLVMDDNDGWLGIFTVEALLDAWRQGRSSETRRRRVRTFRKAWHRRSSS